MIVACDSARCLSELAVPVTFRIATAVKLKLYTAIIASSVTVHKALASNIAKNNNSKHKHCAHDTCRVHHA